MSVDQVGNIRDSLTMNRLESRFQDYELYHQSRGNKWMHYLGIPMIVVTLFGLLSHLVLIGQASDFYRLDVALCVICLASIFYLILDYQWGGALIPVLLGCYFLGRTLDSPVLWGFFLLGWVFQFVGHGIYEKKSPAFLHNLQHLLIGPLWVFVALFRSRSSA